jgi:[ribosomal protein S18]-alanine N-acetyltransferase
MAGRYRRVVIRALRAADVESCARLVAGEPLWQRYRVTLPRARRIIGEAFRAQKRLPRRRDAGEFAVARWQGQVVGLVWFCPTGTFHHSGYIRWILVAALAQGRGIGERLMRHAERRIFAEGPNVFLLVSDFNTGARAFYRKLGYREVGAIPDYIISGVTERLYRKARGPIAAGRGG